MAATDVYAIVLAVLAAAAAGLVGAFALMKRTILAGDVMSHIAIPGLGLAVIWNLNPFFGGGLTLFAGILLIWQLQKKTELSAEAAIGVIFASSVAIGALLINSTEELVDALFGGFGNLSFAGFALGVGASLVIIVTLWIFRNRFIIALFSPELASSSGINVNRMNLVFLLIFGLAILANLRFLGALLVGSLIIIPASAARQLTHSLAPFLTASALISVASMLIGFFLSARYGTVLGPTVVVVSAAFFVLSLLKKKK
ncbi:MAG TPA: metal ABC transporter permease [Candidatus Paceibacterota bacterium]|nr:metal ABC transporter permease [Candidatus Paceibacterota bacterium]